MVQQRKAHGWPKPQRPGLRLKPGAPLMPLTLRGPRAPGEADTREAPSARNPRQPDPAYATPSAGDAKTRRRTKACEQRARETMPPRSDPKGFPDSLTPSSPRTRVIVRIVQHGRGVRQAVFLSEINSLPDLRWGQVSRVIPQMRSGYGVLRRRQGDTRWFRERV